MCRLTHGCISRDRRGGAHRRQLLDWLRERDPAQPVTIVEPHISILAFQGDHVYKLKKAVHFPFIDLSTPEQRRADCEREVALNRRLAPDVYLGVEAVTDDEGVVVDHVVVMRRMPDASRLSLLASHGDVAVPCIDRLAGLIAHFHHGAPTGGAVDAAATRDAVAQLWERELAEYPVSRANIAPLVGRFLAGRAPLFEARIRAGRARDGHGDLLADDVFCLADGPRVLDCLEFDEQLRFGDVLADVAFLAMDLERLGRRDLAERFLERYGVSTHDDWPASLAHFYIAYRAHVRSKIAALGGYEHTAGRLLALAHDHLERGRVRLVLVGGPPATGKTTVARGIAAVTGWPVIRSDEVRKELAGLVSSDAAAAPLDERLYSPEWTELTYESLCERARALLANGRSVVLDASWSTQRWRASAAQAVVETSSDLVALRSTHPLTWRWRARRTERSLARTRRTPMPRSQPHWPAGSQPGPRRTHSTRRRRQRTLRARRSPRSVRPDRCAPR